LVDRIFVSATGDPRNYMNEYEINDK